MGIYPGSAVERAMKVQFVDRLEPGDRAPERSEHEGGCYHKDHRGQWSHEPGRIPKLAQPGCVWNLSVSGCFI